MIRIFHWKYKKGLFPETLKTAKMTPITIMFLESSSTFEMYLILQTTINYLLSLNVIVTVI